MNATPIQQMRHQHAFVCEFKSPSGTTYLLIIAPNMQQALAFASKHIAKAKGAAKNGHQLVEINDLKMPIAFTATSLTGGEK